MTNQMVILGIIMMHMALRMQPQLEHKLDTHRCKGYNAQAYGGVPPPPQAGETMVPHM